MNINEFIQAKAEELFRLIAKTLEEVLEELDVNEDNYHEYKLAQNNKDPFLGRYVLHHDKPIARVWSELRYDRNGYRYEVYKQILRKTNGN